VSNTYVCGTGSGAAARRREVLRVEPEERLAGRRAVTATPSRTRHPRPLLAGPGTTLVGPLPLTPLGRCQPR
jgi:hypothetical protein